jgi:hypothetical protein
MGNTTVRIPGTESRPNCSSVQQPRSWVKWCAVLLGCAGLLGSLVVVVWGAAVTITRKADTSDVHFLERRVNTIEYDVGIIKAEQRMLIDALAPRVRHGGK